MNLTSLPLRLAARVFSRVIARGEPGGVYLTFDDGPDPEITPRVLDIFKENDARATFFVTGSQVDRHPEIVRRIAAEGHSIGNHSYNHWSLIWAGNAQVQEEVTRANDAIRRALDDASLPLPLFRPPYGRIGFGMMRAARELDLTVVLWSRLVGDWRPLDRGALVSRATEGVEPGEIIVLHDRGRYAAHIAESLPEIAAVLKRRFQLRGL
jgi:peptidoglycan/xylan/chitin deacetylase (PgdA/CDA1 family)